MENLNLQYIRKTSRKIIKNKYLTYFVALFTIFFVSESLINSDNVTFIKLVFQNNILKVLVFSLIVIIGYFNMTLGFLLLLNFIFIINVPQRVEGFANNFPNLIDKNEILKYKKNFVSNEPKELKYKSNEEMSDKINKSNKVKESKESKKSKESKESKESNTSKNKKSEKYINNPIRLQDSEKIEKLSKKIRKNNQKTDSEMNEGNDEEHNDDSDDNYGEETKVEKRKSQLRQELEKLEQEENEISNLDNSDDDTIESDIKKKELDKRLKLNAMKEEDESSSESSNSSGSSSSSDSSDDSGKEYDEVSINDARDHVMKKLRNKLKRKYVKGK